MEILRTDAFLLGMLVMMILFILGFVVLGIKFSKLDAKYKKFMQKLGNGKNLEEDLQNYMERVDQVENQNTIMANQVKLLDQNMTNCIQKIGMVRYNAFKDVGSDLSFTLALLDQNNNGVVLNGIYAREMSNIYAKPIKNGKSTYAVSEEEIQAIQKAMEVKVN